MASEHASTPPAVLALAADLCAAFLVRSPAAHVAGPIAAAMRRALDARRDVRSDVKPSPT